MFIEADGQWHLATFFTNCVVFGIVAFILLAERKGNCGGAATPLWYLLLYGVERAVVEGLRTDSLMLGPVRFRSCWRRCWPRPLIALILHARRKNV